MNNNLNFEKVVKQEEGKVVRKKYHQFPIFLSKKSKDVES